LCKTKVSAEGKFEFSFETTFTQRVFIDLPTVRAYMYIQPNQQYEIRIPKKQQLSQAQLLNPFYEKDNVPAVIVEIPLNDINYGIIKYNELLSVYRQKLNKNNPKRSLIVLDSLSLVSDTFLLNIDNEYFKFYKKYIQELLRSVYINRKTEHYVDSVFNKTPVLYSDIAYFNLFSILFQDFLSPKKGNCVSTTLIPAITNNSIEDLKLSLEESCLGFYKDEFASLVMIKGLYDLFYEVPKYQENIIKILTKYSEILELPDQIFIVKNVLKKITNLRPGYEVANFSLTDKKGDTISLKQFEGFFVYLHFYNNKSYAAKQQIEILEKIFNQKKPLLEIVTIYIADNQEEMIDFLKKNKKYKWTFLFAKPNDEILKNYEVINFPSYFLINPENKLTLNPSPTPADDFEKIYNKIFNNWRAGE